MLYIAAGLGALLAHYPMERIGRRGTLLACDVLYVTGGLLCSIVPDYRLIVVGRTLTGVGIGAVLTAVPTLFTEIAPASQRGFVGFVLGSYRPGPGPEKEGRSGLLKAPGGGSHLEDLREALLERTAA